MVDNSFVPRPLSPRTAKQKREELERKMQQSQSARNTAKTTVSSGGRLDVDGGDFSVFNGGRAVVRDGGGFRVEGGGSMEIVDDGEVKAIGDGSDWATGLPIEIAASLSNRETTDSEAGNTSLRPGLYFDFADGALSGNPLTGRVWSYSGADVNVDSARKPSRRYTGGSVVNSCGVGTSPAQMLIQAHAFDPTTDGFGGTNPDGIPLPGSTKGITEVRVEPHQINISVSDFSPPSQPDIYIAGSLDDPTLRMGGKNGTDIKGPLTVDGQPVTGGGGDWESITNKPATFTPSSHTHAIADVTNLQATLNGKAETSHTHAAADINSGTLDVARIPLATTSTAGAITAADKAKLNAVPAIASGKLSISGPVAAGGVSGTVAVTFPAGIFTGAPNMTFGTNDPRVSPNIIGLSAGGCSIRAFNYTNAATTASPTVWWIATNA